LLKTLYPNDNIIENVKYAQTTGTYIEFDQTEFFPLGIASINILMDSTGFMYVPLNCSLPNSSINQIILIYSYLY